MKKQQYKMAKLPVCILGLIAFASFCNAVRWLHSRGAKRYKMFTVRYFSEITLTPHLEDAGKYSYALRYVGRLIYYSYMTRLLRSLLTVFTVSCLTIGLSIQNTSHAAEIILQPKPEDGVDAFVTNIYGSPNYYESYKNNIRVGGWGDYYYGLIRFNLEGLPSYAQRAVIRLYALPLGNSKYVPMFLDRVNAPWNESVSWATRPAYTQLQLLAAAPPNQWYEIDITALYNSWKSGAIPNYGIQLRPNSVNGVPSNEWSQFYSSEYTDNPSLRPQLVVSSSSAILETPNQPDESSYSSPPPPAVVPPGKSKNLISLIHGWNSNPSIWANGMKTSIFNQLKSQYHVVSSEQSYPCDTVETADAVWQICVKDWKELAADLDRKDPNPWHAYVEAFDVGKKLGQNLVNDNYNFIHFIAHSAGSQVADTAATWISTLAQKNHLKKPLIHTTFLDAFDPRGDTSPYGQDSVWAEQYVDSRLTGFKAGGDDYTRIKLPNAYNFDVTKLDRNQVNVLGIHAHGWPVTLYKDSVDDPDGYRFGFNLSKAYGTNPSHGNKPKGKGCIAVNNLVCSEEPQLAAQFSKEIVIRDLLNLPAIIVNAVTSVAGTANLIGTTILKLINGSPVWITFPFDLADNVNFFSFDYTFQQTAEGLLSVFFDDQLVYRADQRLDKTGTVYHSGDVPIGYTTGGRHSLSFRLDAYNGTKSEIDISNVQFGNKQTVTECLLNWAERNYPALFAPSGSLTAVWSVYTYRYYSATNAYVGVSSADNHAYYMGPDGILQDEGPLSYWLPKAGCQ